jgi:hypothetical protein
MCYDPNIPRDQAGSETPLMALRARSFSKAAAFPFLHYTMDNSDLCIHVFHCFITPPISLNIVVVTFPLITCSPPIKNAPCTVWPDAELQDYTAPLGSR